MKKQLFARMAQAAGALALFAVFVSAGTLSMWGIYQPKVPENLLK